MATRNVRKNISRGTRTGSNIGSNIGRILGGLIGWVITSITETTIVLRLVWLCIACALSVIGFFAFGALCLNMFGLGSILAIFVGISILIGVFLTLRREKRTNKNRTKKIKNNYKNEYHFETDPTDGTRKCTYPHSNIKEHNKSSYSNYNDQYRFVKERRK